MRPKISHEVVLELEVAKAFATSAVVNDALRVDSRRFISHRN